MQRQLCLWGMWSRGGRGGGGWCGGHQHPDRPQPHFSSSLLYATASPMAQAPNPDSFLSSPFVSDYQQLWSRLPSKHTSNLSSRLAFSALLPGHAPAADGWYYCQSPLQLSG